MDAAVTVICAVRTGYRLNSQRYSLWYLAMAKNKNDTDIVNREKFLARLARKFLYLLFARTYYRTI